MNNIRITNNTGLAWDTKVWVEDVQVEGIQSVSIDPIDTPNSFVTATLKVHVGSLDILANKWVPGDWVPDKDNKVKIVC